MNSLSTIGNTLRKTRESLGRSINDIANATRIDKKFLDQIEQGITPPLGPTYVRAFIKAYAQTIGLDPVDLLESDAPDPVVEKSKSETSSTAAVKISEGGAPEARASEKAGEGNASDSPNQRRRQIRIFATIALVVVLGLIGMIVWMRDEHSKPSVQEISFSDALKEQELKVIPPPARSADSSQTVNNAIPDEAPRPDSLLLEGVATDSVWIKVVADNATTSEYTFPPLYRMRWKAKKGFSVSMGNGLGASFTLNGFTVGTLGTTTKPVKNYSLNWITYNKLAEQGETKTRHGRR